MEPIRILFVEDVQQDAELAEFELRSESILFQSQRVETETALREALRNFHPHIVISDYSMPMLTGMEALRFVIEYDRYIPVIIFTGSLNESTAVECMKAGAVDYVLKNNITRLPYAVREAMKKKELIEEGNRVRKEEARKSQELETMNAQLIEARNALQQSMAELLREVEERKRVEVELREKIAELERFNLLTVDREIAMIKLKNEINELLKLTGKPERYHLVNLDDQD